MMHIMNGQLMAVFIDDNQDSVITNRTYRFEIEASRARSQWDIWLRTFD